jgi:hypothetical protein
MPRPIHPIAGALALLTILTFWLSTAMSELSGNTAAVVAVKTAIPWGFLILIPALAATGGSGLALARGRSDALITRKTRRMPIIAANGLLILIPCAFFLSYQAQAGRFDATFILVQALELAAGLVNIVLLSLNLRDGLRLRPAHRSV